MIKWFVDKKNKVPLYLQLKDQIKYYISTGAIKSQEQLPPIKILGKKLGINFQTVRKAYIELEKDGLIVIKHGEGTFISLNNLRRTETAFSNSRSQNLDLSHQFANELKGLFDKFARQGIEIGEAKSLAEKVFFEIERSNLLPTIIFAECNQFQVSQISELLSEELNLQVKPMLLTDLRNQLPILVEEGKNINVVTTGFHVNEVRQSFGEYPVQIDVLITNLNPETRRELQTVGENANFGFICRDQESAVLYKELLKAELGFKEIHLTTCTIAETEKVKVILDTSDIILTSPPVYEDVKKICSQQKPVFNVFERVDPMSLKVVRDRILSNCPHLDN